MQARYFVPPALSLHFQMDFRMLACSDEHWGRCFCTMNLLVESGSILMLGLQVDLEVVIFVPEAIHHCQRYLDYRPVHLPSVGNTSQSLQRLSPACPKSLAGSTFNSSY